MLSTAKQHFGRLAILLIAWFISNSGMELFAQDPNDSDEKTPTVLSQEFFGQKNFFRQSSIGSLFSTKGSAKQTSPAAKIPVFNDPPKTIRLWTRFFGNVTTQDESSVSKSEVQSHGFSIGVDRQFKNNFLIGIGVGNTCCTLKGGKNTSKLDADHASIYARYGYQRFYVDVEGGIGSSKKSFSADHSAWQCHFNAEAGTWWESGLAKIEPYVGLRTVYFDDSKNSDSKSSLIFGARYSWRTVGEYAVTTPRIYAGLIHDMGDRNLFSSGLFVDSPIVYRLPNAQISENRIYCGAGFTSSMGTSLDLYIRYTAEIASHYASHTALVGMNWNF